MLRIIGRDVFEGKYADEYTVTLHDLGHGQKEAAIHRSVWWEHTATMSDDAYAMYLERLAEQTPEELEEKRLSYLRKNAQRAKTKVRRICKAMGLDSLLTLTYRVNQTDLELCKRHVKEFVRRVRRLIPGFAYCCAFERQQRGAWHVHIAVHKLPFHLAWEGAKVKSYSVIRAVWRRVVGDLGGNIDESAKKRNSLKTPGKIAAYISKYILKAFEEGERHTNRYSASSHSLPDSVRVRFQGERLADLIGLVYSFVSSDGTLSNPWLSRFGDRFFLSVEPDPRIVTI